MSSTSQASLPEITTCINLSKNVMEQREDSIELLKEK